MGGERRAEQSHECAPPHEQISALRGRIFTDPPPLRSTFLCGCGQGWVVRPTFARGGYWSGPDRSWQRMTRLGSWWLRKHPRAVTGVDN